MTRASIATISTVFSGLLAACGGDTEPQQGDSQAPFRDDWKEEHEGAFDLLDDEGNPAITAVFIGNALGSNDNFVNRGDVIVEFDEDVDDRIKIELRRFTFATSEDEAADIFDKLELWAYNANTGSPKRPEDMEEDARCGGENDDGDAYPWQDGCAIYIYYEGQTQLARAGADIRVTLPAAYRQEISISTADNVEEDSYPNRGNVCVSNLNGTADIELQNGLAFVSVVSETAYPTCPDELIADCENFDDPMTEGPDAWSKDCGCIAQNYNPGNVTVSSLTPSSADITVDVPADLWTNFRAENAGQNSLSDKNCPATLGDLGSIEFEDGGDDPNKPWLRAGIANRPPAAPAGGFRLDLKSNGCEAVAAIEEPKEWDADIVDPDAELRGNIELCVGCIADTPCEDLLPGA